MAQIDPNGLCNSGCWFCPVAYSPNPEFARKTMSVELLESIVKQLHEGKDTFVSSGFNFIYTAHYNEVLLYQYFEEMLQIFRKYGMKTIVLTNGTPLTPAKIDIIEKYQDVVYGICLNVPAAEAVEWGRLTNSNPKLFSKIVSNIEYAIEHLPDMVTNKTMSVQMNGVTMNSLTEAGGWTDLLENAPKIELSINSGSLAQQYTKFKTLFPTLEIFKMPSLIDRAGHLDKHKVMTNINGINKHTKKDGSRVIRCGNGIEVGGRPNGWIHVNANGDMFICCNDYDFETIFGNVNDKPINEIWMSLEHQKMILHSYKTLCTTCASAIWDSASA